MTVVVKKFGVMFNSRLGDGGYGSEYLPIPTGTAVGSVRNLPASVTLGGRAFATNTSFEPYRREAFRHRTIQPQRQSINFENVAGYGTLNTEGLWRRDQMDWSHGAGQRYLDRKAESDSSRFYKSYGVDVWTENELSLMQDTQVFSANTGYNKKAISVGKVTYMLHNGAARLTTSSGGLTANLTSTTTQLTISYNSTYSSTPMVGQSITISGSSSNQFNGTWLITGQPTGSSVTIAGTWTTVSTAVAAVCVWDTIGYKETVSGTETYIDPFTSTNGPALTTNGSAYTLTPASSVTITCTGAVDASWGTSGTFQVTVSTVVYTCGYTGVSGLTLTGCYLLSGTTVTIPAATQLKLSGIAYGKIRDIATDGTHVFLATSSGIFTINTAGATQIATRYVKTGAVSVNTITLYCDGSGNTLVSPAGQPLFSNIAVGMVVTGAGSNASHFQSGTTVIGVSADQISVTLNKNLFTPALVQGQGVIFTLQAGVTIADYKKVWVANDILLASAGVTSGDSDNAHIMCAFANLPDPTKPPEASDVLMIHPNTQWNWSCATAGSSQLYMGGHVGMTSPSIGGVYRSSWSGSTTSASTISQPFILNYPISCLPLEGGEYPTALYAYLNFIFLGTNYGIRMCQTLNQYDPTATGSGDLKAGPLAPNLLEPVSAPVTSIVGNGRFIYFNWCHTNDNLLGTSGWIGRMDISKSIAGDLLSMAYALDRSYEMYGSYDIAWLDWNVGLNCPLATGGSAVFVDSPYKVSQGWMHSGDITYGIADDKIPVKFDASSKFPVATDNVNPRLAMVGSTGNAYEIDLGNFFGTELQTNGLSRAERIGLQYYLNGTGTVVYRVTLQSWPAVTTETNITPVFMFYRNNQSGMQVAYQDPYESFIYIQNLIASQQIVKYTEGPLSANVVVQGMDWLPHRENNNYEHGFIGDCVVTLKTIGGYTYTVTPTT